MIDCGSNLETVTIDRQAVVDFARQAANSIFFFNRRSNLVLLVAFYSRGCIAELHVRVHHFKIEYKKRPAAGER